MKRLSVLIACLLLLSVLAAPALAEETGTAEDKPLVEVKYTFESKDLSPFAQGDREDASTETAGTDGFFTLVWSAKTKIDSSVKEWPDGYQSEQRVNFGGKLQKSVNNITFTTQMPDARVTVWWVEGGDGDRQIGIIDLKGLEVTRTEDKAQKNEPVLSTLHIAEPGTYMLGGTPGNNYIFKVVVTDHAYADGSEVRADRLKWLYVDDPKIVGGVKNGSFIDVTVNMLVGYDGADRVTVQMLDKDNNVLDTKVSMREEQTEHQFSFMPPESGKYKFAVTASRENEEDKTGGSPIIVRGFVLPLASPAVRVDENPGNGSVRIIWTASPEAGYYVIYADGERITDDSRIHVEMDNTSALISGLDVGKTYRISVAAARSEEDLSPCGDEVLFTATENAQKNWDCVTFGPSTDREHNGTVSNQDGSVTIYSEGGKGKIVPGSTDGITFWHTKVDNMTENFVLTGRIHVDAWKLSNGQEGLGIAVLDAMGVNHDSASFWTNSLMGLASKVEYTRDGVRIAMKLGIGALTKTGITAVDARSFRESGSFVYQDGTTAAVPEKFISDTVPLDFSALKYGKGSYNVIGNWQDTVPAGDLGEEDITDLLFELGRDNTGWFVRYLDGSGKVVGEKTVYDADRTVFAAVDPDNVYIGFFAARNVRITVSDISLTVTKAANDMPAREREPDKITVTGGIESAEYINSGLYPLVWCCSADGLLTVKDENGRIIEEAVPVKANGKTRVIVPVLPGINKLTAEFTPDPSFIPGENMVLDSYDVHKSSISVEYRRYDADTLYVSPSGRDSAAGTREDPLYIGTALHYAAAGQTVIVTEGVYHLTEKINVPRGCSGTEKSPVYLIADPEAASRPVLDFGGIAAGMTLGGDWWVVRGLDVCRTSDGNKGIQLSGNHCVLEDINAYRNGNTGIQISRLKSTDMYEDWPHDNLVINCTSFLNADKGYEDADGFAAKLTVGDNNVFDGCLAAYNADDGFDLYAKAETGKIGAVTIRNSVAFMNGYILDDADDLIDAGNGNGFKLGGESLPGGHRLISSIAFANKSKGIDSNSCPDVKVYDSIAFDNMRYNVAFYTSTALNTDFEADGIMSVRSVSGMADNIKPVGHQDEHSIYGNNNYYCDGSRSRNANGEEISLSCFINTDTDKVLEGFRQYMRTGIWAKDNEGGMFRDGDGVLHMNGYLELAAE